MLKFSSHSIHHYSPKPCYLDVIPYHETFFTEEKKKHNKSVSTVGRERSRLRVGFKHHLEIRVLLTNHTAVKLFGCSV